jgi:hypothetical protein
MHHQDIFHDGFNETNLMVQSTCIFLQTWSKRSLTQYETKTSYTLEPRENAASYEVSLQYIYEATHYNER